MGRGNVELHANGVLATSNSDTTYAGYSIVAVNGSAPLRLGTRMDSGHLKGRLDEARTSNVTRSNAWIEADDHSQNDDLIRFGPPRP